MKVISIGDLVTDFYYKNGKLVGVSGGMSSHNIIANLSKFKVKTAVYGVCGDDNAGKVALNSLKKLGVDVENVFVSSGIQTRCFHVSYYEKSGKLESTSKKRGRLRPSAGNFRGVCPACLKKTREIGRMSFFPYTGVYRPTESGRPQKPVCFSGGG